MMGFIDRIFEEIFPIFSFFKSKNNILKKIGDDGDTASKSEKYRELGSDSLNIRIKEEHERAIKIDEKTFKFTLGLSISLTVLAAASGSFVKFSPNTSYSVYISIICGVSSFYMLMAGMTALGAIKTLETYGYGTDHLLSQKKNGDSYLAKALYAQERMNIIRQLRNESAYQSLRNGFLMLFIALGLSVVALVSHNVTSIPTKNTEDFAEKREATSLNSKVIETNDNIENKIP